MNAGLSNLIAQAAQPAAQGAQGGDAQWMTYAIIAFGVALALLVLEAFVPSGGVLGILACICAVGGVVLFFRFDTAWGMASMAVTLLALPFVIGALLWVWPNTPIGRALTLERSQKRINGPDQPNAADGVQAITPGTEGEALTELRPVGACRIHGKRVDCIAHAGVIDAGSKVVVVQADGMNIKVKAVEG